MNKRLKQDRLRHDLTLEYQRAGAIQGKILDADGTTVLQNYFTAFGIEQQTQAIGLADDKIDAAIRIAKDKSDDVAGDLVVTDFTAYCGRDFFDKLVAAGAVIERLKYANPNANINEKADSFVFGGVRWVRYRGAVNGTAFMPADDAILVPTTAGQLLETVFAPADYTETVNTMGIPVYAKQWLTDNSGRSVTLETQCQTLSYCTHPRALIKLSIAA